MGQRLFVGIPLPKKMTEAVQGFHDELNLVCSGANWTKPENLHVTVLFLGDVPDSQYPDLVRRLNNAFSGSHPIELTSTGVIAGPPHRSPTMLWLGFKPSVGFVATVQAARAAVSNLLELRFRIDKPVPHATLARFKRPIPDSCRSEAEKMQYRHAFRIEQLHLFRSELKPEGPIYDRMESFDLRGIS